tara:strand:- start:726 stop:845 length:120 start_codon:yes stop_codon:yes gene_type:complete
MEDFIKAYKEFMEENERMKEYGRKQWDESLKRMRANKTK